MGEPRARGAEAEDPTYSLAARRLHWWTVLLLATQVPLGLFMVRLGAATNFAEPTGKLYDSHKLIGLTILMLVLVRLAYRLAHGAPADEPTVEHWQKAASHITHWAIYALLVVVPMLGWLAISYYGPFAPFGIKLPVLAAQDDAKATLVFHWHRLAAYALVLVIGMHVGAALFHYLIRRDGVLRRMWVRAGRLTSR
jgi:cytochrome b561